MKIRASVLLPRIFEKESKKKYPVRINIGGYGGSCTRASRIEKDNNFMSWWNSENAPEILTIFTDGDGPFGDPYYVDYENNDPLEKAFTEELIPFIEKKIQGS